MKPNKILEALNDLIESLGYDIQENRAKSGSDKLIKDLENARNKYIRT